jgi:fructose-1,6-bisphosphatase/inositol monophosphatase family enzyme
VKDVAVAGAFEQTSDIGWVFDGLNTKRLNGEVVKVQYPWQTHRSTPVYFDLYYSNAYKAFTPLAEKIHIRWSGSNIGSLLYVLTETAAAMGAWQERAEEVGTMYALIKGAGGVAVDYQGHDLGEEKFDTQKTYQILAGSQEIVKFCVETLKQA